MANFSQFLPDLSLIILISRDSWLPNFEKFLISPDFPINFRKSHQISKNYLKRSKSYGQKPLGGVPKDPPGLNRVKIGTNLKINLDGEKDKLDVKPKNEPDIKSNKKRKRDTKPNIEFKQDVKMMKTEPDANMRKKRSLWYWE